jgi:hypothetical protein
MGLAYDRRHDAIMKPFDEFRPNPKLRDGVQVTLAAASVRTTESSIDRA